MRGVCLHSGLEDDSVIFDKVLVGIQDILQGEGERKDIMHACMGKT